MATWRALALAAGLTVVAGPVASAEPDWAAISLTDLKAARALIADNHPGATPERKDAAFVAALARGYGASEKLARRAASYGDYRAVLLRFAASFDDGHIWTNETSPTPLRWPGFFVERSDGRWTVLAHPAAAGVPDAGARLVSCDGMDADRFAERRVGPFVASWTLPAERYRRSPRLLVDFPESTRLLPRQCRFEVGGAVRSYPLAWREIAVPEFNAALRAARPVAASREALEAWNGGYWVRLASLEDAAAKVAAEMADKRAEVAAARFVVIDLRRNGGGNSQITTNIARLLYGDAALDRLEREAPNDFPQSTSPVWRVSPGNLATLDDYITRFAAQGQDVGSYRDLRARMAAALGRGERLVYLARDSAEESVSRASAGAAVKAPRVYLVTDSACFSSCLLAVAELRALGAVHVGQSTSGNTNYSEVREITLPSGKSTFSTLQAWMPTAPRRLGPFDPSETIPNAVLVDEGRLHGWMAARLKKDKML